MYKILFAICKAISLLPLPALYVLSDFLYVVIHRVAGYRVRLVRKNLADSFPGRSAKELRQIERDFYHWFCDYIVETLKMLTISEREIRRRMRFEGIEQVQQEFAKGNSCSLYLGHFGNWEWITSFPLYFGPGEICAQIYHPLENKEADGFFLRMRERFGATSIKMDDTFRTIMQWKKQGRRNIVGYIADQVPGYNNIHCWVDFLNHDTPVFSGAERMSLLTGATVFYGDMTRPRRGQYVCRIVKMSDDLKSLPKSWATQEYFRLLEQSIQRTPHLWLWTHNRWKRTREEYNRLFSEKEQAKRLSKV